MKIYPITVPGGSDSYVQYNNGGIFGGDSTFTFDDTNKIVNLSGKWTSGSFASPQDVTATRQYGMELHYSGNNYDVTGIRSRAHLVTTDTTATALGGLFQAANNDNVDAGVLMGFMAEAIGKSTSNASTISTMRGGLVGTEWGAKDTVTNLKTLHIRGHTMNAAGDGSFGTGYALYIENEAVGGNGQAYDAGIYFKGTNLSGGNYAFNYGIDFSGGTYATANINLAADPIIQANGTQIIKFDDTNYNMLIGASVFAGNSTEGENNVGIGYRAGYNNDTTGGASYGDYNVYIGKEAGYGASGSTNKGYVNVAIGYRALYNCTTGYYNVAIGSVAMQNSQTSLENIAIGEAALSIGTSANYNIAIGTNALRNYDGNLNIGIGFEALKTAISGHSNTGIGYKVLYSISSGDRNTAIGLEASYWNQTGNDNTAIGYLCDGFAAGAANNHSCNTVIGSSAGYNVTTGSNNTIIGYQAGYTATTLASSVLIGYKAGYRQTVAVGSGILIIDNQDRVALANEAVRSLIYGTFAATPEAQTLAFNAAVTLGNLEDGHYTQIEADGTVEFNGNATVWNDANVGAMTLTVPVASQPDEANFLDEGGGDTGITTWAYAIGEKSSGAIEIPHDYKEGSDIYFHIHWQGIAAPGGGTDNVNWQLTYTVAQKDETLDAATTITKEIAIDVQYDFKLSDFAAITGTNFNIGDQFLFTIERIAASADDYAGDCLLATVGLHYECDTCGSRQILTKA